MHLTMIGILSLGELRIQILKKFVKPSGFSRFRGSAKVGSSDTSACVVFYPSTRAQRTCSPGPFGSFRTFIAWQFRQSSNSKTWCLSPVYSFQGLDHVTIRKGPGCRVTQAKFVTLGGVQPQLELRAINGLVHSEIIRKFNIKPTRNIIKVTSSFTIM